MYKLWNMIYIIQATRYRRKTAQSLEASIWYEDPAAPQAEKLKKY